MGATSLSLSVEQNPAFPTEDRVKDLVNVVFAGEFTLFESVSVVLADHETVLQLNRKWLDHDFNTDVISFLLEDDPIEGEVYVDVETASERFLEFGSDLTSEIERYIVHGLLHLCGHDDASDQEREAMHVLENRYMDAAGKP